KPVRRPEKRGTCHRSEKSSWISRWSASMSRFGVTVPGSVPGLVGFRHASGRAHPQARGGPDRVAALRLVRGRAAHAGGEAEEGRAQAGAAGGASAALAWRRDLSPMLDRWTHWVLHHRKSVLAVWIVLFLCGGFAAKGLSGLLTNRFTLPGTDAGRAETILHDDFGQRSTGSFTFVARTDRSEERR